MRHVKPTRKSGPKLPIEILKRISQAEADRLICSYLDALGSPMALVVKSLYVSGDHNGILQLSIDPSNYSDRDLFRRDYAAVRFLQKYKGLRTGINLDEVAIDSARKAELVCLSTNQRIKSYRDGSVRNPHDSEWFRARAIIAKILGSVPDHFDDPGWSKGRTTTCFGDRLAGIYKYASRLDVTWSAQLHALRMVRASPLWGAASLNASGPCSVLSRALAIERGNVLITVPKSAKTNRVICYEPHMNIRLQLAVGSYLKRRLKKFGVDLSDQSINQRRAQASSLTGSLATIDLSMASDTLALELVYELLPIDWALLLDDLRSKETLWPDKQWRVNQKFSSMGNGYTFEVESLIFFALASAVSENVSVFGDDIICPTDRAETVVSVLNSAGFSVNTTKSYLSGPFRESCGMDAFSGLDCTPVYLRNKLNVVGDVVKLHNAIRAWCSRDPCPSLHFSRLLSEWRHIHTCPLGPSGLGDGHYHVDFEEACPKRASSGIDGWWFKTWRPSWRVSLLYGDRVSGRFSDWAGWSALCVSLGPKGSYRVIDSTTDRRQVCYKKDRGLASFSWPGIVWT